MMENTEVTTDEGAREAERVQGAENIETVQDAEKLEELQRRPKFNLNSSQPVVVSVTTQLSLKSEEKKNEKEKSLEGSESSEPSETSKPSTTPDSIPIITQKNKVDLEMENPGVDPIKLEEPTTEDAKMTTEPGVEPVTSLVETVNLVADSLKSEVVDAITKEIEDTTTQGSFPQVPVIVDGRSIERASIEVPVRASIQLEEKKDPENGQFVINRDSETPQASPFTGEELKTTENSEDKSSETEENKDSKLETPEIFVAQPRV